MSNQTEPESESLRIRPTEARDVAVVAPIIAAGSGGSVEGWAEAVQRWVSAVPRTRQIWVAEWDGEVVAHTGLSWIDSPDETDPRAIPSGWYLNGVDVHEDARRRGIATALTRHRLNWLTEQGHTGLVHYVRYADNIAVDVLHTAFGFRLIREDVRMNGLPPDDRTILLFARPIG